ncbi:hypothetical protein GCM10010211_17000 [Streptomyces albospinus]|uniref:Uncharacterized protein n=1 Tax=Streptomyces albospinus TaxID=285515 RepID=A0ABQ2UU97_9ACTN|nr:hypothetical protein GCM10010211_17000 [Streptomyces albospinus]
MGYDGRRPGPHSGVTQQRIQYVHEPRRIPRFLPLLTFPRNSAPNNDSSSRITSNNRISSRSGRALLTSTPVTGGLVTGVRAAGVRGAGMRGAGPL